MENILEAKGISKSYGNHKALDMVSLTIPRGSIYGLLGPNGAGKTTFIRIINQIVFPDKGEVLFEGTPLKPENIAHIGYLPEERGLYKTMKVGEQALYLAQLKGLKKSEAKKKLFYWFERLDIGNWWDKKIQELSKGMAQKIQFIVTVLHEPKLLIFDEPFSGFDPINANQIKDQILHLKNQGTSIIFSTHRMESVEELCEHIALIHKSKKIIDGELFKIKQQFKQNEFELLVAPTKTIKVEDLEKSQLFKHIEVATESHNSLQKMRMKLNHDSTKPMLALLSEYGNIIAFNEIIPTANDIFIQSIKNTGSWEN